MATIKIQFKDLENGTFFNMMFGDSYKTWREQYREFLSIHKDNVEPIKAWISQSEWKGFGGLKWCSEEDFQHELNREDVQQGEPDNKNPRKYLDFKFKEYAI